jgi:SAM-dependent methyltransferase
MDLREQAASAPEHGRHTWELVRCELVVRELQRLRLPAAARLLDVGAGDCYVGEQFLRARVVGTVAAIDANFSDEQLNAPGHPRLSRARELPPEGDGFDVATLLDVIEHVEDDVSLLTEVRERMGRGGRVVVTVPAWPSLFSAHDVFLAHHRRYTPDSLNKSMRASGFEVVRSGGFFRSLVLPRVLAVAKEKLLGQQPVTGIAGWRGGPLLTKAITTALRIDAHLPLQLPGIGLSLLVVGRAS